MYNWGIRGTILLQDGAPVDSIQLPYKWLNSMVHDRYTIVNVDYNGL